MNSKQHKFKIKWISKEKYLKRMNVEWKELQMKLNQPKITLKQNEFEFGAK